MPADLHGVDGMIEFINLIIKRGREGTSEKEAVFPRKMNGAPRTGYHDGVESGVVDLAQDDLPSTARRPIEINLVDVHGTPMPPNFLIPKIEQVDDDGNHFESSPYEPYLFSSPKYEGDNADSSESGSYSPLSPTSRAFGTTSSERLRQSKTGVTLSVNGKRIGRPPKHSKTEPVDEHPTQIVVDDTKEVSDGSFGHLPRFLRNSGLAENDLSLLFPPDEESSRELTDASPSHHLTAAVSDSWDGEKLQPAQSNAMERQNEKGSVSAYVDEDEPETADTPAHEENDKQHQRRSRHDAESISPVSYQLVTPSGKSTYESKYVDLPLSDFGLKPLIQGSMSRPKTLVGRNCCFLLPGTSFVVVGSIVDYVKYGDTAQVVPDRGQNVGVEWTPVSRLYQIPENLGEIRQQVDSSMRKIMNSLARQTKRRRGE